MRSRKKFSFRLCVSFNTPNDTNQPRDTFPDYNTPHFGNCNLPDEASLKFHSLDRKEEQPARA